MSDYETPFQTTNDEKDIKSKFIYVKHDEYQDRPELPRRNKTVNQKILQSLPLARSESFLQFVIASVLLLLFCGSAVFICYNNVTITQLRKKIIEEKTDTSKVGNITNILFKFQDKITELTKTVKAYGDKTNISYKHPDVKENQHKMTTNPNPTESFSTENNAIHLNNIPTYSVNGIIVWRLKEFSRILSEAKHDGKTKLYSKSFFTNPFGYKMKLYIYPNGKNEYLDTCLSIFFILEKGEMDNILQWPFNYNVSIMILNPSQKAGTKDEVLSFSPDLSAKAFQQPSANPDDQEGWGWFNFIEHKRLEQEGFIKDDDLFIKAVVHLGDENSFK